MFTLLCELALFSTTIFAAMDRSTNAAVLHAQSPVIHGPRALSALFLVGDNSSDSALAKQTKRGPSSITILFLK